MAEPVAGQSDYAHDDLFDRTSLGFWVYLMTDCVLFGTLFAVYAVLRHSTFGGPPASELFSMPLVLFETFILLISSFTCGMAMMAVPSKNKMKIIGWLFITFILGLTFVAVELYEFAELVHSGNSWKRSGFLSAFFTLVGTHGAHVTTGLLWMGVIMWQIWKRGITSNTLRRFTFLRMFWHFLEVVWIFIFTFVYLMGVI